MTKFEIGDVVRIVGGSSRKWKIDSFAEGKAWIVFRRKLDYGRQLIELKDIVLVDPQADMKQAIREVLLSDEFMAAFAAAFCSATVLRSTLEHPIPGVNRPMRNEAQLSKMVEMVRQSLTTEANSPEIPDSSSDSIEVGDKVWVLCHLREVLPDRTCKVEGSQGASFWTAIDACRPVESKAAEQDLPKFSPGDCIRVASPSHEWHGKIGEVLCFDTKGDDFISYMVKLHDLDYAVPIPSHLMRLDNSRPTKQPTQGQKLAELAMKAIWAANHAVNETPVIKDCLTTEPNPSESPNSSSKPTSEPSKRSPSGYRMLGSAKDEPRQASDLYWSLSAKNWIPIKFKQVEYANRDDWVACRKIEVTSSPPKRYRDPTKDDLKNGPIACEYRDYDNEQWKSGLLVYVLDGNQPFLCVNKERDMANQRAQCQIEVGE